MGGSMNRIVLFDIARVSAVASLGGDGWKRLSGGCLSQWCCQRESMANESGLKETSVESVKASLDRYWPSSGVQSEKNLWRQSQIIQNFWSYLKGFSFHPTKNRTTLNNCSNWARADMGRLNRTRRWYW